MNSQTPSGPPATQQADGPAGTPTLPPASGPRAPGTGVDAFLAHAALLTSGLALLLLAGIPPAGNGAGDIFRGIALLGFWLIAPGAVVVTRLRLSGLTKVAVTPLIGIGLLIAIATVGSWTGVWVPRASTAVVAFATLVAAVVDSSRRGRRLRLVRPSRPRPASVALLLGLLVAVGLWVASLPAIENAPNSVLGLLVAGPWTFPAAILITTAVLLVALGTRHLYVAATAGLALVLLLRTTAPVVSPVPILAWTYKHLGVVRALQDSHEVAGGMDIYMHWPGMFAAGAYFSDTSGVEVIDLARWFAPLVHVLIALQTAALARALGARAAGCIAAAALVVGLNWVGQDYFSPQAVAMCLAGGIVVLVVQSSAGRAHAVLALALFPAIVVSHQLTPVWLLGLVVLLALFRRTPWWVPVGMGVVLLAFLLTRLEVAEAYGLFTGFDPVGNAASGVLPVPALGRDVGGIFAKATSLLMWGATLVVLARRALQLGWKRGWRSTDVLVPGAIAFSPILLLAAQNYGGEANLRVTLYSALGCCAVLGPALAGALRRRSVVALAAAAWTVVAVGAAAQSFYGMWSTNLIRSEDVQAARWLAEEHPDAVVIPMINVWPGRTSVDYERFIGPFTKLEPGLDEMIRGNEELDDSSSVPLTPTAVAQVAEDFPETYVVFTETMRQYDAYYAAYSPGDYADTLEGLTANPEWELARHEDGLWVFRYLGPATPVG